MSEKRLNVLFISLWYPNRVKPLLGIFVKKHALAVAKYANVSVVYVYADQKDGLEECDEESVHTIRAYYKRVKYKIPIISIGITGFRYIMAWKKALCLFKEKKGKPDVVHSNIVFPVSLVALYLKIRWRVPYIITEHWSGYLPEDGRYKGLVMKRFSRLAVKYASAITVVSEYLKEAMLKAALRNSYSVISNVVDTKLFTISIAMQKPIELTRFLHVSSLCEEEKNVIGIVHAFAKVNKDFPKAELTIVGPRFEAVGIKNLCDDLKLGRAVQFLDYMPREKLVEVMNSANAFVLFSNFETQSVVLLESICCGVPVISSKVKAVMEYVTPANGILVEPGDESQLYQAMVYMIKNSATYKPEEVRKTVVEKVSPDAIAKQFLDLYHHILKPS